MHAQFISRLAVVVLFLLSIVAVQPVAAQPKQTCECLIYVQLKLGTGGTGTDAFGAGPILVQRGLVDLVTSGDPRPGDIVILQPGFKDSHASAGHIAFIRSVERTWNTYRITVEGTKQGQKNNWTDAATGCTDVSLLTYDDIPLNSSSIAYYRLKNRQPDIRQPANGDTVVIRSEHSNLVVDVKGRGTGNGTIVQQSSANGGDNQRFILTRVSSEWFTLRPRHATNMCLDVKSRSTSNGATVQISRCNSGTNQQFKFVHRGNGRFAIIARHSDAALDVTNWSTSKGTPLQMWRQHPDQKNQQWTLEFR